MTISVAQMLPSDWESVREIYAAGIATGNATFEPEPPSWEYWDRHHHQRPRLVARDEDQVVGWAALSPVSERRVYRGVADNSIYVAPPHAGRGVGRQLLQTLIRESEATGIWTIQAGIFPENLPSLALHRSCGFREVGRRERLGQMGGVWRDVILMERRSPRI